MPTQAASAFDKAVLSFAKRKVENGTVDMSARAWNNIPLAMRERAIFSAHVSQANVLEHIQKKLQRAIDLNSNGTTMSREQFVLEMKDYLVSQGYSEGGSSVRDITSQKRLRLIYDMNVDSANAYGRFVNGQSQTLLNMYPAYEFCRVKSRKIERQNWAKRFKDAGGTITRGGKMYGLKTNLALWQKLSVFGRPFPPFDYGSGMGLRPISRQEAINLKLIGPKTILKPNIEEYNKNLQSEHKYALMHPESIYVATDGAATLDKTGRLVSIKASTPNPALNEVSSVMQSRNPTTVESDIFSAYANNVRTVSENDFAFTQAINELDRIHSISGVGNVNILIGNLKSKTASALYSPSTKSIILNANDCNSVERTFANISHEFGHHIEKELIKSGLLDVVDESNYIKALKEVRPIDIGETKQIEHDLRDEEKLSIAYEAFCAFESRKSEFINRYKKTAFKGGYTATDFKPIREKILKILKEKKWTL